MNLEKILYHKNGFVDDTFRNDILHLYSTYIVEQLTQVPTVLLDNLNSRCQTFSVNISNHLVDILISYVCHDQQQIHYLNC